MQPERQRHQHLQRRRSRTGVSVPGPSKTIFTAPAGPSSLARSNSRRQQPQQQQQHQQHHRQERREDGGDGKRSVDGLTSPAEHKTTAATTTKAQVQQSLKIATVDDVPHPQLYASSSVVQDQSRNNNRLYKRAPPVAPKHRVSKSPKTSLKSSKASAKLFKASSSLAEEPLAPMPKTPLILLPDSRSVWQTSSYNTVKWSRKYIKSLPRDTTVDIILVDSKTNQKVFSLKRFIPFYKGSAQVWVPPTIPEGVSFVLVLELYHGRSKQQVTETAASSLSTTSQQDQQFQQEDSLGSDKRTNGLSESSSSPSGDALSTVVRRSDISIASRSQRVARDSMYPESLRDSSNRSGAGAAAGSSVGSHRDINNDDYYTGASEERAFEFMPEEMREEYPNTARPLDLEHTFGLYQKVYALTPYTLKWKIPERVAELMEYTRQIQLSANIWNKSVSQGRQQTSSAEEPKEVSVFMAKVMVELVLDENMESVSVLARDLPAETMFQYLTIQDHVMQTFYRLRVQMVVVQVKTDVKTLAQDPVGVMGGSGILGGKHAKGLEGWDFPTGGEVIDRYEAITRKFWVSQGAL
ncbi:hypothetical protein BGZ99_008178 [Dissophora globulifera]|uniref:Uncharacterized protein n=1 Tax=Dissophora globulifera TaxID=979702 RepID=A0A9P6RRL1_9FUNG|nr:hypothetical protein BGZ99_008178 [Dissophora globulifera]